MIDRGYILALSVCINSHFIGFSFLKTGNNCVKYVAYCANNPFNSIAIVLLLVVLFLLSGQTTGYRLPSNCSVLFFAWLNF